MSLSLAVKVSLDAILGVGAAVGPGGLPYYLGPVANRARTPTDTYNAAISFSQRTYHYATDDITSLRIAHCQWDGQSNERSAGGTATWSATIEYPIGGARYRFLFGGATSLVCPDGATSWSDDLAVTIPRGAKFYVHQYFTGTSHIPFNNGGPDNCIYQDIANGDAKDYSGADLTSSGTYTDGGANGPVFPAAIIGRTSRPTVGLIGDSRTLGYGDTVEAMWGNMGETARSIAPYNGVQICGLNGDTAANWLGSGYPNSAKRRALLSYCSHIVCELGGSDILNYNATGAATIANLQALRDSFTGAGKGYFQTTFTPRSSSSDGWITAANQTTASQNPELVAANTLIRAGAVSATYFDQAAVMEDTAGGGKWKSTGGLARTADGTHANPRGYAEIEASGAFSPAAFGFASTGLLALTAGWAAACSVAPSNKLKLVIDQMIATMQQDGDWGRIGGFLFCATEDEQQGRVNLVNPTKVAANNNSTTFTALRGFAGDTTSMNISWPEAITASGDYTQNSAMFGLYCNLRTGTTGAIVHGGTSSGSALKIQPSTGSTGGYTINSATSSPLPTPASGDRTGFHMLVRPDSANQICYLNGLQEATAAVASTGVPAGVPTIFRFGSATYGRDQIAAMLFGGAKDANAAKRMHARIHRAMITVGAQYAA